MKTHRNTASPVHAFARMLFALCCLVLMLAQPALAQDVDENGRSAADRAVQGAVRPEAPSAPIDDLSRPCDWDDCSKSKVAEASSVEGVNIGIAGSNLGQLQSLRIQEGAPDHSVFVAKDGAIGFGTKAPMGRLHVVDGEAGDILVLDNNGNLEIGGLLTEASSRLLKENFAAVDALEVLNRVVALPITTWNYKSDDPAFRHMGPMAQDFYAAFGLGADDAHIAPLDANGVAFAAMQALYAKGQAQAERIATLEQQNADLLQRLQALEALVLEK